jgi:hypothetical protein
LAAAAILEEAVLFTALTALSAMADKSMSNDWWSVQSTLSKRQWCIHSCLWPGASLSLTAAEHRCSKGTAAAKAHSPQWGAPTHHVLDVDERVLASPLLQQRQCVADELAQAVILLLRIVNAVTQVLVPAMRYNE